MTIPTNDQFVEITTKAISNLVEKQFPAFYRDQSPMFIAFIKAYYEWLETANHTLFYSRRYFDIKDIDKTLDQFLVYFKQKYFRDIQLDTAADTRSLIKHALDIYRSKGTPREIELLFQLVYQKPISIYFPSTDLFKTSDGVWNRQIYLELSLNEYNIELQQREVQGLISGATAFVDRVIRTTVRGRLIDVAFISAIRNDFITYEKVFPIDQTLTIEFCPHIIGSLTNIDIFNDIGTGGNYKVGDILNITSATGTGATGRVVETVNAFGVVIETLINGGYGYSNTANVYISTGVLSIVNAQSMNLRFGDTVTQVGTPNTTSLYLSRDEDVLFRCNTSGFYVGEDVITVNGAIATIKAMTATELQINTNWNKFQVGPIIGLESFNTANVTGIDMIIGVYANNQSFTGALGNILYANNLANCSVLRVFNGQGASLTYNTNTMSSTEYVNINNVVIGGYLSTLRINATAYGFPGNVTSNYASGNIGGAWTYSNTQIGKIENFTFTAGANYDHPPFIIIKDSKTEQRKLHNYQLGIVGIAGPSGLFMEDEIVVQAATNARGMVLAGSNSSVLRLQNMRYVNTFVTTTNATTKVVGTLSDTQANVAVINYDPGDWIEDVMGRNAYVEGRFGTSNGAVRILQVVDSGYGFVDNQLLTFVEGGEGFAVLGKQGQHDGYYQEIGGFLSHQKKLFDGDFYQNYSYQIISPIIIDKYREMMQQLGHPAGTKMFGLFKHDVDTEEEKTIQTGSIIQT